MVIALLQLETRDINNIHQINLGNLLLSFFEFYGQTFNYVRVGISVRHAGSFFAKLSRRWSETMRPYLLCVENPNDVDVDIGKSAGKIIVCRSAFKWAYQVSTRH